MDKEKARRNLGRMKHRPERLRGKQMRSIRIGFPSGTIKMVLWEGTEDEKAFPIKSLKRGKPYVMAYGIKYELTDDEVNTAKAMLRSLGL